MSLIFDRSVGGVLPRSLPPPLAAGGGLDGRLFGRWIGLNAARAGAGGLGGAGVRDWTEPTREW